MLAKVFLCSTLKRNLPVWRENALPMTGSIGPSSCFEDISKQAYDMWAPQSTQISGSRHLNMWRPPARKELPQGRWKSLLRHDQLTATLLPTRRLVRVPRRSCLLRQTRSARTART